MEEITLHKLRHTFGTQMAAAGAPLRAIQEGMGHGDAKTREIYAHCAPDPTGAQPLRSGRAALDQDSATAKPPAVYADVDAQSAD